MIAMYHPETAEDVGAMLKDMFSDTIEDMLQAELSKELEHRKHDRSKRISKIAATQATQKPFMPSFQIWKLTLSISGKRFVS